MLRWKNLLLRALPPIVRMKPTSELNNPIAVESQYSGFTVPISKL